jgi:RNA polymerase subunit RPABC4/transcription elongation factor Spt4
MALVKCKECGSEVSTKAKVCPKCGAKAPKKTSMFTWLVLVVILVSVYNVMTSGPSNTARSSGSASKAETSSSGSNGSDSAPDTTPTEAKAPEWSSFESTDEMTGDRSAYAVSPNTEPTRRMDFPYGDVEAWLAVGCDASSEWAYIGFNQAPNLNDGDIGDGYRSFRTRVRWDDNVVFENLTQKWGAEFMHFRDKGPVIQKIGGAGSVMVELNWHGQGAVRFPFTLNGSSKALQDIRSKCSRF